MVKPRVREKRGISRAFSRLVLGLPGGSVSGKSFFFCHPVALSGGNQPPRHIVIFCLLPPLSPDWLCDFIPFWTGIKHTPHKFTHNAFLLLTLQSPPPRHLFRPFRARLMRAQNGRNGGGRDEKEGGFPGSALAHSVPPHTVLFFKIYAVEIGHQFRARGIIRIGQDYISSQYEQVPTSSFGENLV